VAPPSGRGDRSGWLAGPAGRLGFRAAGSDVAGRRCRIRCLPGVSSRERNRSRSGRSRDDLQGVRHPRHRA
jgi:hypothetical protein